MTTPFLRSNDCNGLKYHILIKEGEAIARDAKGKPNGIGLGYWRVKRILLRNNPL